MRYEVAYDVGESKRVDGINEDSVTMTVFEQGHRDGYRERADAPDEETEPPTTTTRSVGVFALADGAGGRDAGDRASYVAATVICEELAATAVREARNRPESFGVSLDAQDTRSPAEFQTAVADAIETAHERVIAEVATTSAGAYTTVVAGIAIDGRLHLGWVGDSRAYVCNLATEDIARLTRDHTVVERLRDQGTIDDIEAHVHPRGNEITRALGGTIDDDSEETDLDVETRTVGLYAEDVVLVTSDGLIDAQTDASRLYDAYVDSDHSPAVGTHIRNRVVTDDDLSEIILDAQSLGDAGASLVELANDRGGKDNVSTLLFRDPHLDPTPDDATPALRGVDVDRPVENRETVLVNSE